MRTKNQNLFLLGAGSTLILVALWFAQQPKPVNANLEVTPALEAPTLAAVKVEEKKLQPPQEEVPALNAEQREFQAFLDESYRDLTRPSDLNLTSGQHLHDTPPESYRNSEAFGRIMDQVKAKASYLPQALDFYERCALNSDVIAPTRSICLAHLKYWSAKKNLPFNEGRFPSEILATAKILPVQWE